MKAVYPGTFDPVTFGHLDVVKRALRLFSSVTVAVAENPGKKPLFPVSERVTMIRESLPGVKNAEVKSFNSLLVDFMRSEKSSVVIRGLRETSDFPLEFQHAIVNRVLDPAIETVFVMTSESNFYVTSGIVKEIASHKGPLDAFVPRPVEKRLRHKFP